MKEILCVPRVPAPCCILKYPSSCMDAKFGKLKDANLPDFLFGFCGVDAH